MGIVASSYAAAGISGNTLLINSFSDLNGSLSSVAVGITITLPSHSGESSIDLTPILADGSTGAAVTFTNVAGTARFEAALMFGGNATYIIPNPLDGDGGGGGGGGGGSITCFAAGSRVLTQNGYKAVESLTSSDLITTSDGRSVPFKRISTTIESATTSTAPYRIDAHAFGHNNPVAPVFLSARHKIQLRKGLWTCPMIAAKTNSRVIQYGVGESVTYYHIRCPSYFKDNLVTEGMTVESFGLPSDLNGAAHAFTWNSRLNGLTRMASPQIKE
jgi:hypothetical protein